MHPLWGRINLVWSPGPQWDAWSTESEPHATSLLSQCLGLWLNHCV